MRLHLISIGIFLAFLFTSCKTRNDSQNYVELAGYIQGTTYRIVAENRDEKNLQKNIDSIFSAFDIIFNNYNPLSTISRINNNDSTVNINEYFKYFMEKSQYFHTYTNGAFDITIAPLANAWHFGFTNDSTIPNQTQIDSLLQFVGMGKIKIQNNKIVKQSPHIQIIGNAIAKGYSTDLISEFLLAQNIQNFLVDVGGEMRVHGVNQKGNTWNIGISTPQEYSGYDDFSVLLSLHNKAIATSGNYRKFYMENGEKYSHTINPQTGYPITHNLLSASIITDECIDADALATACMVVGLEKSIELIAKNPKFQAVFLYEENDSIHTYISSEIEKHVVFK